MFGEDVVQLVNAKFADENNVDIDAAGRGGGTGFDGMCISTDQINDVRAATEFRMQTFSNFKKTDAKKELLIQMLSGNIERANYWCAEFVCAGSFHDLWDAMVMFTSKYINLANPKLATYLYLRYIQFQEIVNQRHYIREIDLRNNEQVRKIFSEIVSTLTVSDKSARPFDFKQSHQHVPTAVDTPDTPDTPDTQKYNILTDLSGHIEAQSLDHANAVMLDEDPREIFVAVNELGYHLSSPGQQRNLSKALFWIEWLIEFDLVCRRMKKPCRGHYRDLPLLLDNSHKRDIIWVVWECLVRATEYRECHLKKNLLALQNLFSINFTHSSPKKKKATIYFALTLVMQDAKSSTAAAVTDLIAVDKKPVVKRARDNVELIYREVKKNEVSPRTEYLFRNLRTEKTDFQKTIEKMHILNHQDARSIHNSLL